MEEQDNTYGKGQTETGSNVDTSSSAASNSQTGKRNYERYLAGETWSPDQNQGQDGQAQGGGNFYAASYEGQNRQDEYGMSQPNQVIDYHGLEEPVSMGEWVISLLIMLVPCLNIVMMFVWAFSKSEKKSKSNFYKACLIFAGVIFLIYLAIGVLALVGYVIIG